MAKLTSKMRAAVPTSEFGLPKQRKYPMPDREHAALAKSYATKNVARGNALKGVSSAAKLSPEAAARIRTKANKILKAA